VIMPPYGRRYGVPFLPISRMGYRYGAIGVIIDVLILLAIAYIIIRLFLIAWAYAIALIVLLLIREVLRGMRIRRMMWW